MKKKRKPKRLKRPSPYYPIPLTALGIFILFTLFIKADFSAISKPIGDILSKMPPSLFPTQADEPRDIYETGLPQEHLPPMVNTISGAPVDSNIKEISIPATNGDVGVGSVFIQNKTKFQLDVNALLKQPVPVTLTEKGVQVLIVHTHGSEAYAKGVNDSFEYTDVDRTSDKNYNVVRVGAQLAKTLNEQGVSTLHVDEIFDVPSYSASYTRSLEAISKALKENPSIKVIIDVHRDSMISKDGIKYKTMATINGNSAAQLMFVTGSAGGGLAHKNWQKNLGFHMKITEKMNEQYPGIMRPLILRNERFNQHASVGSMLLEVGTSGNTLDEALYSVTLFGQTLSGILKK